MFQCDYCQGPGRAGRWRWTSAWLAGKQYCGSVGNIANSQVGVYLGYASRKGFGLIEGQLVPPDAWLDDKYAHKRAACGVPMR
ncbi:MAG TPA: transposase [Anaerolineaceae bacterium]|nr:transposase [Anaerolineaceae bacterium]